MKKIIIILILLLSNDYAQDFGQNIMQLSQESDLINIKDLTYTPIEKPIDPDKYILGPGDLLGVNIVSKKNISLSIRINPVGEIMIPLVGILNVNGMSLSGAKIKISDYITKNILKNAIVNVTLLNIRKFKIQVLGAIYNPGFIEMTPVDKVHNAILKAGGVQKYAHKDTVKILRDEKTIAVMLKDYLSGDDISQNISLKEGDVIYVPFSNYAILHDLASSEYNNHQVIITGYVNRNSRGNAFNYYPGYTVYDYIAMAGGTKEAGSIFKMGKIKRTIIHRSNGVNIKNAIDEIVLPGDVIEIPPSLLYQIVGRDGTIGTFASIISSAYLIYAFTR